MSVNYNFVWCLHCERTFPEKFSNGKTKCIYIGCDGHFGDIWEWKKIREAHPDYPNTPETGKVYPLYKTPEAKLRLHRLARQRRKETIT